MQKTIKNTEVIAYTYLTSFGFPEDSIKSLIKKGASDLEKELLQLQSLMKQDPLPLSDINNSIHALKGLFFNLGNTTLASQLNEINISKESKHYLENLKQILHL